MAEETTVWKGSPSQILNYKSYLACLLLMIIGIVGIFVLGNALPLVLILAALVWGGWVWITLRCTTYELTTQRLLTTYGVFNRRQDTLELYRIKDIVYLEPFWMRLFSVGNLVLQTSDRSTPEVVLQAIRNVREIRDKVRELVEIRRSEKGVKEIDME